MLTGTMWEIVILLVLPLVSGFSNVGTSFYVAFPPSPNINTPNDGECQLYINTLQQTDVAIIPTRTGLLETFTVFPAVGQVITLDCLDRVEQGLESKVVRIVSTQPISVHLYTKVGELGDIVTVFPRENTSYPEYNYYLNSFTIDECVSATTYGPGLTLGSYSADSLVLLYNKPVGTVTDLEYQQVLGLWDTWGDLRACNTQQDLIGYSLRSTNPVSVISGSLNSNYDYSSRFVSGLHSAVSSEWVSTGYIVPPIVRPSGISASFEYYIKVISLLDDTIVAIRNPSNTLVAATSMEVNEVFEYLIPDGTDAYNVTCSENCVVFAYPRRTSSGVSGGYLFHVPSTNRATNQAVFRKINSSQRTAAVSIISNTVILNLNGANIEATWIPMNQIGLYFTTIQIPATSNTAQVLRTSTPGGAFQAYINGELSSQYSWYGDIVAVGEMAMDPL